MTIDLKNSKSYRPLEAIPEWVLFLSGNALLVGIALLDIYRPLNQSWSIFYVFVLFYANWLLRGYAEWALIIAAFIAAFLVPTLLSGNSFSIQTSQLFHRLTAISTIILLVWFMKDRRRAIDQLHRLNADLEQKIADRTSKLELTNESLRGEIDERKSVEAMLRDSRQRLEQLSRQLITTREAELQHLSRELHDEIGQLLTVLKMKLRRIMPNVSEAVRMDLEEDLTVIDRGINQIRNLSLDLRPPHLNDLGLVATLHWYLRHQSSMAGIETHIDINPTDLNVPADLGIVCFRITQEAITNAIRHANVQRVHIELRHHNGKLDLAIRDDGIGFDVTESLTRASSGVSMGLINMQERASLAGGKLEIESELGEGTTIRAQFLLPSLN